MRTAMICCVCFVSMMLRPASADLVPYSQNFEGLTPGENVIPNTLSNNGWLVGANVYSSTGAFIYNYFAFPAPNGGPAFSGVVTGQGGPAQGSNQLSVYSDYNNADHANPNRRIESFVFRDMGTITAADVGKTILFTYDAKMGNLVAPTTATAYLKILDLPSFGQTAISSANTTSIGINWSSGALSLTIDPSWVGDLVQIGFTNTAGGYVSSGVFYDNLRVKYKKLPPKLQPISTTDITAIPEPGSLTLLALGSLALAGSRRRALRQ